MTGLKRFVSKLNSESPTGRCILSVIANLCAETPMFKTEASWVGRAPYMLLMEQEKVCVVVLTCYDKHSPSFPAALRVTGELLLLLLVPTSLVFSAS